MAGLFGENVLARFTGLGRAANNVKSSCADLFRVSTSLFQPSQGVDGRHKAGQDEIGGDVPPFVAARFSPDSPAQARRESSLSGALGATRARHRPLPVKLSNYDFSLIHHHGYSGCWITISTNSRIFPAMAILIPGSGGLIPGSTPHGNLDVRL